MRTPKSKTPDGYIKLYDTANPVDVTAVIYGGILMKLEAVVHDIKLKECNALFIRHGLPEITLAPGDFERQTHTVQLYYKKLLGLNKIIEDTPSFSLCSITDIDQIGSRAIQAFAFLESFRNTISDEAQKKALGDFITASRNAIHLVQSILEKVGLLTNIDSDFEASAEE